jgi:dCTP deaminase
LACPSCATRRSGTDRHRAVSPTREAPRHHLLRRLVSYGYDVRVGPKFKIFTPTPRGGGIAVVDPKTFDDRFMVDVDTDDEGTDHVIIPPNSFALCETVEVFDIPRDVLVICVGKSTYARCGLIVNVTPLEPEWRGKVTLEISNTTPLPAKVYANEGVAQMIFLKADKVCA